MTGFFCKTLESAAHVGGFHAQVDSDFRDQIQHEADPNAEMIERSRDSSTSGETLIVMEPEVISICSGRGEAPVIINSRKDGRGAGFSLNFFFQ